MRMFAPATINGMLTPSPNTSSARFPSATAATAMTLSRLMKDAIAASGLVVFPKTGHAVNLEEPDLFNKVVGDFLARVDSGAWQARDPRTRSPEPRRS